MLIQASERLVDDGLIVLVFSLMLPTGDHIDYSDVSLTRQAIVEAIRACRACLPGNVQ